MRPLRRRWDEVRAEVEKVAAEWRVAPAAGGKKAKLRNQLQKLLHGFADEIADTKVLDPACGSGNFLYVALRELLNLEKEVIALSTSLGFPLSIPTADPRQLYGIEINEYAHELAQATVWIGYIQWLHENGFGWPAEPLLKKLDNIEHKDAILAFDADGNPVEPEWPAATVVIGNPPFLGSQRLRAELGDDYVELLFSLYGERLPGTSDLCCYWFEKGRWAIENGRAKRVGLLATQAIRGGANRRVLQRIKEAGDIFYAQADRKWIQDGVAVRVSMVGFDDGSETHRLLNESKDDSPEHGLANARPVEGINANLTHQTDVTKARRLKENLRISFMGDTKVGPFEIPESLARQFLAAPNPHGRPNSDVVRPWVNGLDITRRPRRMWIVDFPPGTSEEQAALYEAPFEHIKGCVKSMRATAKSGDVTGVAWWIHQRPRPEMRQALQQLGRYVGTPRLTKYRFFVWLTPDVLPDAQLIVFARDDDYFFGVLHSRAHEVWALEQGTQLESRPRYTPPTCFETFPFPDPSPEQKQAIASAAKELDSLRQGWLNPAPVDGLDLSEKELKRRTLTNLYNQRPTWLVNAHAALDAAAFAAYGWGGDVEDAEILARLLKLNLEREPAEHPQ